MPRTRTSICQPPSCGRAASSAGRSLIRFERPTGTSWRVATQLSPRRRPAVVHGAQPAVPDGQSVGIRHLHAAVVHRARRSAYAGLPRRGAPHRHRRRGGRPRSRRRRRSCAKPDTSSASIHRSKATRTRSSPTTCRGRMAMAWSIATAPSSPRRHPSRPTALDLLDTIAHEFFHYVECRAHPTEVARAFQFRGSEHVGRALARRRLHELLRSADVEARRADQPALVPQRRWATPSKRSPRALPARSDRRSR